LEAQKKKERRDGFTLRLEKGGRKKRRESSAVAVEDRASAPRSTLQKRREGKKAGPLGLGGKGPSMSTLS